MPFASPRRTTPPQPPLPPAPHRASAIAPPTPLSAVSATDSSPPPRRASASGGQQSAPSPGRFSTAIRRTFPALRSWSLDHQRAESPPHWQGRPVPPPIEQVSPVTDSGFEPFDDEDDYHDSGNGMDPAAASVSPLSTAESGRTTTTTTTKKMNGRGAIKAALRTIKSALSLKRGNKMLKDDGDANNNNIDADLLSLQEPIRVLPSLSRMQFQGEQLSRPASAPPMPSEDGQSLHLPPLLLPTPRLGMTLLPSDQQQQQRSYMPPVRSSSLGRSASATHATTAATNGQDTTRPAPWMPKPVPGLDAMASRVFGTNSQGTTPVPPLLRRKASVMLDDLDWDPVHYLSSAAAAAADDDDDQDLTDVDPSSSLHLKDKALGSAPATPATNGGVNEDSSLHDASETALLPTSRRSGVSSTATSFTLQHSPVNVVLELPSISKVPGSSPFPNPSQSPPPPSAL
ncbi:hypothetical protein BC828DRAFT_381486 [Blastocladiella britannica]|nr:hypothetical protein BC828DRAFT_381486 [Blastocladiella britannica]